MQLALALGYNDGGSSSTHNVGDNTSHVQDTVDTGQQTDGLQRQIDCIERKSEPPAEPVA